jgi:hypothetical protein
MSSVNRFAGYRGFSTEARTQRRATLEVTDISGKPRSRSRPPLRILLAVLAVWPSDVVAQDQVGGPVALDLAALAQRGALRADTREVSDLVDGAYRGVRVSRALGFDVVWIDSIAFSSGAIELDVRGQDVQSQSFLGLAIGGLDASRYESVFVRPFNFRATDPLRRMHAIQYESMPTHPWSRLRREFPEVYENPTDPPPDPNDWVRLRLLVQPSRIQIFVGEGADPDLVVERINARPDGRIGLWVGNFSGGDFANLRMVPAQGGQ